ncbi:endonuclease III [Enterococcus sulfureus ATCC 49903]|uniref:Endonuclease III n=1 Tax=Enterococcus sulfureus ATCC 49903 TaxID=1140003 RepID=S0L7U6_9ENTE|nr:endonuclease III [Enterococcus sulfureus]EOT47586.1 endonuclease III [Enterococcus sulfureus ATCC 49903]EOT83993.1 endonuclease III [Enterococcus sulfureus ATCC 49903]
MISKETTRVVIEEMFALFPDAHGELVCANEFELLISVMLSAQATDISVNKVTPALFKRYPTPEAVVASSVDEIIPYIRSIGLYRNKAKNIYACCQALLDHFDGQVPKTREELMSLAGVGRKTADVVLADAFGIPAFAVDTHVERISKRLRICRLNASVLEVEETLMKKIPESLWIKTHHTMIFFGRYHCTARAPKCETCPVLTYCQEGKFRMRKKLSTTS